MAEIVNLNRVRKQQARADREIEAEANRQKFGRTKAMKTLAKAEKELAEKSLNNHKIKE